MSIYEPLPRVLPAHVNHRQQRRRRKQIVRSRLRWPRIKKGGR